MTPEIRMSRYLYDEVRTDLERPHPFAAERLGFLFGKLGNRGTSNPLVLLHRYGGLRDDQYVDDPRSGGRMDSSGIREAMQEVLDHRKEQEGAFHVHLHEHHGPTGLSLMDRREIPELVRSLRAVGRSAPHGFLVLSLDHGLGWVWLPQADEPLEASRITVVGAPISVFERQER